MRRAPPLTSAARGALVSFVVAAVVMTGGRGTHAQTAVGVTFVQWTDLHGICTGDLNLSAACRTT